MADVPVKPIIVAHLFAQLRDELINLLKSLQPDEWERPTACAGWSVKDVALHILGDDIGLLSWQRDGFTQRDSFAGWDDLVGWINQRNAEWVGAARRFSTTLLCDLLRCTGDMVNAFVLSLKPEELGPPVNWAGDDPAPKWLGIAREFTEYWMHHQHIAEAVRRTSARRGEIYGPVLDTFCRALPHAYRATDAPPGTVVTLRILGEAGGDWHVRRNAEGWALYREVDGAAACTVTMNPQTVWQRFTKGISPDEARQQATIEGQAALAEPLLQTVAIIG